MASTLQRSELAGGLKREQRLVGDFLDDRCSDIGRKVRETGESSMVCLTFLPSHVRAANQHGRSVVNATALSAEDPMLLHFSL